MNNTILTSECIPTVPGPGCIPTITPACMWTIVNCHPATAGAFYSAVQNPPASFGCAFPAPAQAGALTLPPACFGAPSDVPLTLIPRCFGAQAPMAAPVIPTSAGCTSPIHFTAGCPTVGCPTMPPQTPVTGFDPICMPGVGKVADVALGANAFTLLGPTRPCATVACTAGGPEANGLPSLPQPMCTTSPVPPQTVGGCFPHTFFCHITLVHCPITTLTGGCPQPTSGGCPIPSQACVEGVGLEAVDYRHGDSPSFYPIKMPGLGRVWNVVDMSAGHVAAGAPQTPGTFGVSDCGPTLGSPCTHSTQAGPACGTGFMAQQGHDPAQPAAFSTILDCIATIGGCSQGNMVQCVKPPGLPPTFPTFPMCPIIPTVADCTAADPPASPMAVEQKMSPTSPQLGCPPVTGSGFGCVPTFTGPCPTQSGPTCPVTQSGFGCIASVTGPSCTQPAPQPTGLDPGVQQHVIPTLGFWCYTATLINCTIPGPFFQAQQPPPNPTFGFSDCGPTLGSPCTHSTQIGPMCAITPQAAATVPPMCAPPTLAGCPQQSISACMPTTPPGCPPPTLAGCTAVDPSPVQAMAAPHAFDQNPLTTPGCVINTSPTLPLTVIGCNPSPAPTMAGGCTVSLFGCAPTLVPLCVP